MNVMRTLVLVLLCMHGVGFAAGKPNLLIIITDDQGYGDLGCYGNKLLKTPRLDQLAQEGTRFTSFYAQSVCGPSRSALFTGRHPDLSKGWRMPATEITFAELLQDAGYQTACIGKWELSDRKRIPERMPNAKGIDYFYGSLGANDSGVINVQTNEGEATYYRDMGTITRHYTDASIDYLKNKRDPKKPFLLYLAHPMPHVLFDASEPFKGKSKGGLYGDVIEELDYETGRLLDALDELWLRDNTLVIFTSDNGPWNQPRYVTGKLKDLKNGNAVKKRYYELYKDINNWGVSGPLRNGKGSSYEGGYRVPCIVRWPGKVPAGRVNDAIFASIDFLPTFAKLCGYQVPGDRVIDGIDQTDLLTGKRETGRSQFVFLNTGIRVGKWKYLDPKKAMMSYSRDPDDPKVHELYDLSTDLGETRNVAASHPELIASMRAKLAAHKQRAAK